MGWQAFTFLRRERCHPMSPDVTPCHTLSSVRCGIRSLAATRTGASTGPFLLGGAMSQTTLDVLAALVIYGAGTGALRIVLKAILKALRDDAR